MAFCLMGVHVADFSIEWPQRKVKGAGCLFLKVLQPLVGGQSLVV